MRNILLNEILPFWMKNSIDYEYGGIITTVDREGKIFDYEKNVWFLGRTMYTYSVVYNTIEKNEEYLKIAKHMYDFMPKCEYSENRLPFIVNREGKPIVKGDAYYSETFAAIGLAEYYIATGDKSAWEKATRYFDLAYSLYDKELSLTPDIDGARPTTKALGPSMIMLNVCQIMRKVEREKYHNIAKRCADEIISHLTPMGLLENVGMNGEFIDSAFGREINPGHSLEAAWFLLAEAIYRNDDYMKAKAKEIIDISWKIGYRDGAIIAFADCLGNPSLYLEWDMKIMWPQCEALIALRLAYSVFKEEKYLENYNALREYVFSHYPDKEYGEWYYVLHSDGTVANTLKGNFSKGPYHLPRMLILLDRLEGGEDILI